MTVLDRFRSVLNRRALSEEQEYERLQAGTPAEEDDDDNNDHDTLASRPDDVPFSWLEYIVFVLLGIAMLWAWNMYLAAAPYFAQRFAADEWVLTHFQPSILTVGTIMNLVPNLVLAKMQAQARYPKRVAAALIINIVAFVLLSISTISFQGVSAAGYLVFVLIMVFSTSVATGLCQNGAFALAAGFGHPSYIQGIMTGQGIAGVLPSIAQIASVLAVPPPNSYAERDEAGNHPPSLSPHPFNAALVYFSTAAVICAVTLLAFIPLVRRHNRILEANSTASTASFDEAERARRKVIGLVALFKKLRWLTLATFICFAITMFYPVFTAQVLSNADPQDSTTWRLLHPASFIPLAFLFWNLGDLLGRLSSILPFSIAHRPFLLFTLALARIAFLPLYLLCNIRGRGAVVPSDLFYLVVVQLGFGLTNGWIGSACMMGAVEWVDDGEKEATGAFMGLVLVAGLAAGSLLSFTAASV